MSRVTLACLAALPLLFACSRKAVNSTPSESRTAPDSSAESIPSVKAPPPPEPGRAELTFSGAFNVKVVGDGTQCDEDGSFTVLSPDIQGFGTSPEWSFVDYDGRAYLNVGPSGKSQQYSAPVTDVSTAFRRQGDRFVVDLELKSETAHKVVRAQGFLTCPSKASVNQMPEPIVQLLRKIAAAEIRRFSTFDFGRAKDVRSISAVVPEATAESILSVIRRELPLGFAAYIGTTRWLGDERHEGGVELVIGPVRDQFDILRLAQSDAVNYGLTTEALVKKLRAIHASTPIEILQAETDTVQFRLLRMPANLTAFAKDLHAFCPDIVDQGVGTLEALEKSIVDERRVYLWWD